MAKVPVLIGSSGVITGEHFVLGDPCDVVIGRSRSCEISLQVAQRYQSLSELERAKLEDFNSVSRRHVRLTVIGPRARFENLSQSGSFLNGARFERAADVDLAQGPVELRLSAQESLTLVLADREQLETMLAKTRPLQNQVTLTPSSHPARAIADPAVVAPLTSEPIVGVPGDRKDGQGGGGPSTWPSQGTRPS